MKIVHEGSGAGARAAAAWTGTRTRCPPGTSRPPPSSASTAWCSNARERRRAPAPQLERGDFRVEEFRVPLVDARLAAPAGGAGRAEGAAAGRAAELPVGRRDGAGAAARDARLLQAARRATLRATRGSRFEPPRDLGRDGQAQDEDSEERAAGVRATASWWPTSCALDTDRAGAATLQCSKDLPPITRPSELLAEVTYNDPNGEAQTVATTREPVAERGGAGHQGRLLGQPARAR